MKTFRSLTEHPAGIGEVIILICAHCSRRNGSGMRRRNVQNHMNKKETQMNQDVSDMPWCIEYTLSLIEDINLSTE